MDKILLNSKFAKLIMSKLINRTIKKTYGVEAKVSLGDISVQHEDGGCVQVNIGVSASMKEEELSLLLDTIM